MDRRALAAALVVVTLPAAFVACGGATAVDEALATTADAGPPSDASGATSVDAADVSPPLGFDAGGNVCAPGGWCWVNPILPDDLAAVWGSADDDVWAVGAYGTILHWNGSAWSSFPSGTLASLTSVWGSASDDVWAVGLGAALHWDGSLWSKVESVPSIAGEIPSNIEGSSANVVWGTGGGDVWEVDSFSGNDSCDFAVINHWDGTEWDDAGSFGCVDPWAAQIYGGWSSTPSDAWAVGSATYHWDGSSWTVQDTTGGSAVWGTSSDDVWRVGGQGAIAHWDGSIWTAFASGTTLNLTSIAGVATNDIWVGGTDFGADAAVLLHWDGSAWTVEASGPSYFVDTIWMAPSGTAGWGVGPGAMMQWSASEGAWSPLTLSVPTGSLQSLSGTGPGDVWAVGGTYLDDGGTAGAVAHWNGAAWSAVPVPGAPMLEEVWASGPHDAWAVGGAQDGDAGAVLHWNGSAWSAADLVAPAYLYGVWGSGPGDAWAVGDEGTIVHWDGSTWSAVEGGGSDRLRGLWGSGPDDVWAVGMTSTFGGVALHWDGSAWTTTALAGLYFADVWGASSNDVWIVGEEVFHWDGASWTEVTLPNEGIYRGVWGTSGSDVWIVGQPFDTPFAWTTPLHWDGTSWTEGNVGGVYSGTSIWGSGAHDVWTVSMGGSILHHS